MQPPNPQQAEREPANSTNVAAVQYFVDDQKRISSSFATLKAVLFLLLFPLALVFFAGLMGGVVQIFIYGAANLDKHESWSPMSHKLMSFVLGVSFLILIEKVIEYVRARAELRLISGVDVSIYWFGSLFGFLYILWFVVKGFELNFFGITQVSQAFSNVSITFAVLGALGAVISGVGTRYWYVKMQHDALRNLERNIV